MELLVIVVNQINSTPCNPSNSIGIVQLQISEDIYADETIVTADTGFANEQNMKYLKEEGINAYLPDNQFRS